MTDPTDAEHLRHPLTTTDAVPSSYDRPLTDAEHGAQVRERLLADRFDRSTVASDLVRLLDRAERAERKTSEWRARCIETAEREMRVERERDAAVERTEWLALLCVAAERERDAAQASPAEAYDRGEAAAWNRHLPNWRRLPNPYRARLADAEVQP